MKQLRMSIIALCLFCLLSCKKFIDIKPPEDQIAASVLFSDEASANAAMLGLYSNMMTGSYYFANGGITIAAGLSADEIYNRISSSDEVVFYQNSISASDEFVINTRLWSAAYKTIYHANAIIEGIKNATGLSEAIKSQIEGEAKFIRAFHYFYLINLFGDVPLILSTNYKTNSIMPRTAVATVYEAIISDLKEAELLLPREYPDAERLRPNSFSATALLARIFLFRKEWVNAEAKASDVINADIYGLEKDLNQVFLPTSPEIIWQLYPVAGSRTPVEAQAFLPASFSSAKPFFPFQPTITDAFEQNDQRKEDWVQTKTVDGIIYSYSTKYKIKVPEGEPREYNVAMRLAETFLIRAEARMQQGNYTGSQDDLNMIRNRAGLSNTTAVDAQSLSAAIEQERRIELLDEWGHRWFDLKRWGRADIVLASSKAPYWQATDVLYPIPFTEIKRNPYLIQNPGY